MNSLWSTRTDVPLIGRLLQSWLRRSGFKQFVTRLVWDSLSADACPIEMVSANNGKLSGYHNLDYETIRLTWSPW